MQHRYTLDLRVNSIRDTGDLAKFKTVLHVLGEDERRCGHDMMMVGFEGG